MSEVLVVARGRLRAGQGERLLVAAALFVAATRQEAGCLEYDLYLSATAPEEIATVERWASAAAAEAHMAAAHTSAFLGLAMECLAAPPVIRTLRLEGNTMGPID